MYAPLRHARGESIELRRRRYQVWHWGDANAPLLVLLHGWMDCGMSFQFMVDQLRQDWHVIAPDWRGFGQSQWNGDSYWFPDYLADLDALLAHYSPVAPANLLGHSMGGIVACLYAGICPERVRRLVSVEGFGLPATEPGQAVGRLRKWLGELREQPGFGEHAGFEVIATRLMRNNKRLSQGKADFLACYMAAEASPGLVRYTADPLHKMVNPVLYRLEEAKAIWREVTAPTLWIQGDDDWLASWLKEDGGAMAERTACFRDFRLETITDAGHMLHHDQPLALASLIEPFLV